MVMDAAAPSPQSVGREFVRQYYTLLNKAPNHLHRFYNHQSSFVHGGLEPNSREGSLVIGQKQIHNKIQQLNFRDCHAKISQVDSQATLGNGVVVQVTGELSNDGQPMRRFTQTFVLAAQTPKKYYVHNDIFRYQDVWADDEQDVEDNSDRSEVNDTDVQDVTNNNNQNNSNNSSNPDPLTTTSSVTAVSAEIQTAPQQQQQQQPPMNAIYYNNNAGTGGVATGNSVTAPQKAVFAHNGQQQQAPIQVQQPVPQAQQDSSPLVGGTSGMPGMRLHHQNLNNNSSVEQPSTGTVSNAATTTIDTSMQTSVNEQPSSTVSSMEGLILAKDKVQEGVNLEKEVKEEESAKVSSVVQPELKTYAQLIKLGGSAGIQSFARPPQQQPASTVSPPPQSLQQNSYKQYGQNNDMMSRNNSTNSNSQGQQQQGSRQQQQQVRERRSSTNANHNSGMGSTHYSDNNQLFIGNIPHHASEEELKTMFGKYGTVVDLRIFTKQGQQNQGGKMMTGGRVPQNYGFITFKDPESAQAVLSNHNICFPDDSPDGQKLNIEEKINRMRSGGDGNGGGDRDRRSMNSHLGNGQRPSGGGMMRPSGGPRIPRTFPRGGGGGGNIVRNGNSSGGGAGGPVNNSAGGYRR